MLIKTKRSRSFTAIQSVKGISIQKMKQDMETMQKKYEKIRCKSQGKLQIGLRPPLKLKSQHMIKKQSSGCNLPELNKRMKLTLDDKKGKKLPQLQNLVIKLSTKTSLKQITPNRGYVYLDISDLNCSLNPEKRFQIILQKNGVIIENFEKELDNQFYQIDKFHRILETCKKIKKIQFFANLEKMKLFSLWKSLSKKETMQKPKNKLEASINVVYIQKLCQIRNCILQIRPSKFIQPPRHTPITIQQYQQYLYTGCNATLNHLESELIQTVAKKAVQALENEIIINRQKIDLMYKDLNDSNSESKIKLKPIRPLSKNLISDEYRGNKQFFLNYEEVIRKFTGFYRKIIYFLGDFSITLFKGLLTEIQHKITRTHDQYLQRKRFYIQYLSKIQNNFIPLEPKDKIKEKDKQDENRSPQEIFMTETNQIQLIKIQFNFDSTLVSSIYEKSNEIVRIFRQFVNFVKKVLDKQSVLDFQGVEPLSREIFKEVATKIDEYKFSNFLKELKEYKNFSEELPNWLFMAAKETEEVLNYIIPIAEEVNEFIKQGELMIPKNENSIPASNRKNAYHRRNAILADVTKDKQSFKNLEESKNSLLNFFQRKTSLITKLNKLPNCMNISIYCVSLQNIKIDFQIKITMIQNQIKRFIPESFDKIADEIISRLADLDKRILVYNWTVEEFVMSAKGELEYNQLNMNGSIFKYVEGLNKFLAILLQVSEPLHKEKSLKAFKVRSQIKILSQKIEQFASKKIQRLKDFKNAVNGIKEQIWRDLARIQNDVHAKINKEHEDIKKVLNYFRQIQQELQKAKKKIDNVTFIENLRFQNSLSTQKPTQFASYIKLKNDSDLLKQFIQKYVEIKQKIERVYEEPLKSKIIFQIIEDINEGINDCRMVQQSLVSYLVLINEIKAQYFQYHLFFETVNQISYLEEEELEQIENKKYFDFTKKKHYCIQDIYKYRLHQKRNQLNFIFLKKYYRKVLSDLILDFEDFVEKKNLSTEIEVIKYIKSEDFKDNSSAIVSRDGSEGNISDSSRQRTQRSDGIMENSSIQDSECERLSTSFYKRKKKRSMIEATSTQKIPIFSQLFQYKCVLKDFEMELNELRNTCDSISEGSLKEQSIQISSEIKTLTVLLGEMLQEQDSYIELLKNGCLKKIPFFEDISDSLQQARLIWNAIINRYEHKSLAHIMKSHKQFKKTINGFKKLISKINSTIESKIQDRRRQLSLLYLCSKSTVLKIIQNPLYFIHEFYASVDEVCLDPENSSLTIQTFYRQELKVVFKARTNMQLNKIRQQISRQIKLQCYLNLKETILARKKAQKNKINSEIDMRNVVSEQVWAVPRIKNEEKELIQVSYLCYYVDMQFALQGKDKVQINGIINRQISYMTNEYQNLHSNYENLLLKIDTLLSLCLELRSRGKKGQQDLLGNCLAYSIQLIEDSNSKATLLKETFKSVLNQKKLQKRRSNSREEFRKFEDIVCQAQEVLSASNNFIITQQKVQKRKVNFGAKKMLQPQAKPIQRQSLSLKDDSKLKINTQNKKAEFNSFKVKLCNYFYSIELSYDLIDPKGLVHYVSSQRMLLNLFNSFYDPMKPTIVQDPEPIQSFSSRLFRLFHKISYPLENSSSKSKSNFLTNCMKLGKIAIAFCLDEENEQTVKKICSFLSETTCKYQSQILGRDNSQDIADRSRFSFDKESAELRIPNLFIINKKNAQSQVLKAKREEYRVISLEVPFMEQILQMFIVSMRSRYSDEMTKIVLEYVKTYQFFSIELKGQKMNIESSKEMLAHILEEIQIVISKEYRQCVRNCVEEAVRHKIESILSLPLYSLGLKEKEVGLVLQKFLDRLCIITQGAETQVSRVGEQMNLSEQKKTIEKKTKALNLQKQLSFMLSPMFQSRFEDHEKIIALIGSAGTGKSYCIKECMSQYPEQIQVEFINVMVYDEYTQFLVTPETVQQLRCKLMQKYDNNIIKYKNQRRRSETTKKKLNHQKIIMVYCGLEGIRSRRTVQLCELLVNPEESLMQRGNIKSIIQLKNLHHLCPKTISNLHILSFGQSQVDHQSYLWEVQQCIISLQSPQQQQKDDFRSDDSLPPNKNPLQKSTLKPILNLIPLIYNKMINPNEDNSKKKSTRRITSANMKLCVSEKQFYIMLTGLFTSIIYKYERKWRDLINMKLISAIASIKRVLAFCVYWVFYCVLEENSSRVSLYDRLAQIRQFQQIYTPKIEVVSTLSPPNSMKSAQFHRLSQLSKNSQMLSSNTMTKESIENIDIEFTDDGIVFVKSNAYIELESQEMQEQKTNLHQFLTVETNQIKGLTKICRILLNSRKFPKGIYVFGDRCTGKSKFIKKFLDTIRQNSMMTLSNHSYSREINRVLDIQIKDHLNTQSPYSIKETKYKNRISYLDLFSRPHLKASKSSSSSLRQLSHKLFRLSNSNFINYPVFCPLKMLNKNSQLSNCYVYVDDCSMSPQESLNGSIVHQFFKTMCESNYFLFNQEIITMNNFQVFYESRTAYNKAQTYQLIADKWFMFPIHFSTPEDYLQKVFSTLIRNSLNVGANSKQIFQISSKSFILENLAPEQNKVPPIQEQQILIQSLMSAIVYLKEKNAVFELSNGEVVSKNKGKQSSMLRKPATWLYQFTYKNVYNTLFQFITLLKSNQNKKALNNSCEKITIKYADSANLELNTYNQSKRTFISNFELLQTMIIFKLTSRFKSEHQDFYSLANLCEKKQQKLISIRLSKQNNNTYQKYRNSSIFNAQKQIDLLAEKLAEKRSLRKPIIFNEFRENLYKFQYAIKTSRFILINRSQMFDGANFIDTVGDLLNLKVFKVDGVTYDFQATLSRLSKSEKNRPICVYIPLETIYNCPEILNSIEQQIKSVYCLRGEETFASLHQEGSIKDLLSGKSCPPSLKKFVTRDFQPKDYQFTFVIQYPSMLDVASLPFIQNQLITNHSSILWLEHVTASSEFKEDSGPCINQQQMLKEKSEKDAEDCLQMLRRTGRNKSSITVEYLAQIYQKKSRQQIEYVTKIIEKLMQHLEKQFKNILPPMIYAYVFSYSNFLQCCKNCIDIYTRSETETNNRIKSIESALSSLEFLFREYEILRGEYLDQVRKCKELEQDIWSISQQIESKRKVIQQYISSGDQEEEKLLHRKCRQNEDQIVNINKKTEGFRILALKNYEEINRNQIAELKYLLNSSFEAYQEHFELIAIVLGEDVPVSAICNNAAGNIHKQTLRKYISDVNMMTRIKEQGLLEGKSEEVIKLLAEKLVKIDQRENEKTSFMKKIYGWIKYSVQLNIFSNAKKANAAKLKKQIEQAKDKIVQIYEKYKVENSIALINILEKQKAEKQTNLKKITFQCDRQSIKLAKCAELVQNFTKFQKFCLQKLQNLSSRKKSYLADSIVAAIECCLTFSMPFDFRGEFRGKYERAIQRIVLQKDKLQKRIHTDLVEADLKNFNMYKQNEYYCITNHTPFFLTKQRKRLINAILRSCCNHNSNHRKLTIVDPHQIFIRQFSIVTDLSYICLNLEQLSNPDASKLIENFNVIFIATPPGEWTIQFARPETENECILDIKNYRIKWNKIEVKVGKNQRCIILKESVQNLNDLAHQNHNIMYYDLDNLQQNEKIVQKILQNFHYRDYCSIAEKKMPQLKTFFQTYPQKSSVIIEAHSQLSEKENESMFSLIEQICKNSSNFRLNRQNYVTQLSTRIDSLFKWANKCNLLNSIIDQVSNCVYFEAGIKKYLDDCGKKSNFLEGCLPALDEPRSTNVHPGVGEHNSIGNISKLKQLSQLIAISFQIARKLMSTPSNPPLTPTNPNPQNPTPTQFYTTSYTQKLPKQPHPDPNHPNPNYLDLSILKTGIQAAYEYAIQQTKPEQFTKYFEQEGRGDEQQNVLVFNMLRFLFGFLVVGVEDGGQFYYQLQLRFKGIWNDRKSNGDLPEEFFKLISLSNYIIEQGAKPHKSTSQPVEMPQQSKQSNQANQNESEIRSQIGRSQKQLTEVTSGQKVEEQPGLNADIIMRDQRERRVSIMQRRKKSISTNSQIQLAQTKSKFKINEYHISNKDTGMGRMLMNWEYAKIKQKHKSTNFINSGFEKAFQTIYKLTKKSTNESKRTKPQLLTELSKQIESLKQITPSQKLELYSYFNKPLFRQQILNKSIDNMHRYQLAKDDGGSDRLTRMRRIIWGYLLPGVQGQRTVKDKGKEKERDRRLGVFCGVEDGKELGFVLDVMRMSNREIDQQITIKAQISSKLQDPQLPTIKQKFTQDPNCQKPNGPNIKPYYIIYKPTSSHNLSIKQLQKLYISVEWPSKVFVVVLTEQYWLKQVSKGADEKSPNDFLYGIKHAPESTKKSAQHQPSKPLQQIQYLLSKDTIILSHVKHYYGQFHYKRVKNLPIQQKNKNKFRNLGWSISSPNTKDHSQLHLSTLRRIAQKPHQILFNTCRSHLTTSQLLPLLQPNPNPNQPNHLTINKQNKSHKIETLSPAHNVHDMASRKIVGLSGVELKVVGKYRVVVQGVMRAMGWMDRIRAIWEFQRFVEVVCGQMADWKPGDVHYRQQYLCRCIQTIFLPNLPLPLPTYSTILTITHNLPLHKLQPQFNKPILPHTTLHTFDLDNSTVSMKAIEYLSTHAQILRLLASAVRMGVSVGSWRGLDNGCKEDTGNRLNMEESGRKPNPNKKPQPPKPQQPHQQPQNSPPIPTSISSPTSTPTLNSTPNSPDKPVTQLTIIREFQLQHCLTQILKKVEEVMNWMKIYQKEFLLSFRHRNYGGVVLGDRVGKGVGWGCWLGFRELAGIVSQLVGRLENYVIWKECADKIYLDNLRVPASKYLLLSTMPSDVRLILQPTHQPSMSASPIKHQSNEIEGINRLKLFKTNKIFANQSLLERIETNQHQFRILPQDNRSVSNQVENSKGRSGFYEKGDRVSVVINSSSNQNQSSRSNHPHHRKSIPNQQKYDSDTNSQQQQPQKEKTLHLTYPLLNIETHSNPISPSPNFSNICSTLFQVEIDEDHIHQLMWRN